MFRLLRNSHFHISRLLLNVNIGVPVLADSVRNVRCPGAAMHRARMCQKKCTTAMAPRMQLLPARRLFRRPSPCAFDP